MGLRIANLLGMTLALDALRGQGPVLELRRDDWGDDPIARDWGRLMAPPPGRYRRKSKHRTLPNEYPKSPAVKRRRARNRMAAKSRRRNRS